MAKLDASIRTLCTLYASGILHNVIYTMNT